MSQRLEGAVGVVPMAGEAAWLLRHPQQTTEQHLVPFLPSFERGRGVVHWPLPPSFPSWSLSATADGLKQGSSLLKHP